MPSNEILTTRAIEKSETTLDDAKSDFSEKRLESALNRIYYAIFYIVLGLAYKHDFVTSKHYALMSWFNKKFINEDKVFDTDLFVTYRNAFDSRTRSDYDLAFYPNEKAVEELLYQAEDFIQIVKNELMK